MVGKIRSHTRMKWNMCMEVEFLDRVRWTTPLLMCSTLSQIKNKDVLKINLKV